MKYLKIIPLAFLFFTLDANAEIDREDNCNIIGDMAFIIMTQRQSGLSKEEVNKDIPFENLTKNEKKIIDNLIGTVYKTPIKGELNTYESLEKFSEIERVRCNKLIQGKI
ncbi:hypothetical protein [Acinetobacter baumannii]|uniref:hypothetical protein n=1 Tax=Acinetobacter baumannii TaxID=470 RepID=UPI000D6E0978|nr:hypothetical protein [Acinetobacter baumannii]